MALTRTGMARVVLPLIVGALIATVAVVVSARSAGAASSVTLGASTCATSSSDVVLGGTWNAVTSTCTVSGVAAVHAGSSLTVPSGTTLLDSSSIYQFGDSGSVVNQGVIDSCYWDVSGQGVTTNDANATFDAATFGTCSSAEVQVFAGGQFDNYGSYDNTGTLLVDGYLGGVFTNYCGSVYTQTGPVVEVRSGTVTLPSGCPQTITFSGPATGLVGGSYTPSATSSSGLTVSFSVDTLSTGCSLDSLGTVHFTGAGTCLIDAGQAGDATYALAPTVQVPTVISLVPQTITFSGPATGLVGGSYTPSATSSSGLTVSFSVDTLSTGCSLDSLGTVHFTGAGTCLIDAGQAGDATYALAPTVQVPTVISLVPQTITFSGPATGLVGGSYTPSATSSSGLTVSFSVDTLSTGCSLDSLGTVHFTGAGTCLIDASQAGDATYALAPTVQVPTVISLPVQSQTITFAALSDKIYGSAPFKVSATASSGLPVSFVTLTPTVCGVSGSTVSLLRTGQCTIQARQLGDASWLAATPVSQSFNVDAVVDEIAPGNQPIGRGQWFFVVFCLQDANKHPIPGSIAGTARFTVSFDGGQSVPAGYVFLWQCFMAFVRAPGQLKPGSYPLVITSQTTSVPTTPTTFTVQVAPDQRSRGGR